MNDLSIWMVVKTQSVSPRVVAPRKTIRNLGHRSNPLPPDRARRCFCSNPELSPDYPSIAHANGALNPVISDSNKSESFFNKPG